MNKLAPIAVLFVLLAPLSLLWLLPPSPVEPPASPPPQAPAPPGRRLPWTTSRITGSPEPPPAYRTVNAFPHLKFDKPVLITHAPGTDRLFVAEQHGKIYSFRNDPSCTQADLLIDLRQELQSLGPDASGVRDCYGLAFHPDFAKNRYCYVTYVLNGKKSGHELPDGTRVSRFTVGDADPPRIDPQSEKVIITWLAGGHNGGCLKFGPDRCLYISTGDATPPSPPDGLDAGQDMTRLLSSILRIDVDHPDGDRPYSIPVDNPFVNLPGARGEKWAYGFRNPWKMSFDRQTGELWVGDVGWELWEMVYRVEKGGNYGWSVREGPQPVRPDAQRGPTPIRPPALALPHAKAASITGGYVYRGQRLPGLVGAYVFGDWETRRLWAARFDDGKLKSLEEITEPTLRVVAFGEDRAGELYIADYDEGTIHRLEVNEAGRQYADFPRRLSETGLFQSLAEGRPAPGVVPFAINAEMWADGARADRFLALPGNSSVIIHDQPVQVPGSMFHRLLEFPKDAVLAKTLWLETERGKPASRRRIETQVLHFTGKVWNGYTYRWNDAQTDAELVDADGAECILAVTDPAAPGGRRQLTWTFAGRAMCGRCHNPWAEHTLAFNLPQLDRPHPEDPSLGNQLDWLRALGLLVDGPKQPGSRRSPPPRLTNPYDEKADLNERARSYLQVNCAHCHQFGAGGSTEIDLRHDQPIMETKTLGVRPVQGTFEIPDAQVLAAGDPYRSVLFYRISKLGRGRMPMVGSEVIDERGVRLIHDWIRQLPMHADHVALVEQLRTQAQPKKRAEIIGKLLGDTSAALLLARSLAQDRLPAAVRQEVITAALARPEAQVRDLFEPFVSDEQRARRLGSAINPKSILAQRGDAARGRELFFNNATMQCKNCHRVGGVGSTLGPDLSDIGKRYNREQLLESILEPSKVIDPKYVSYAVATTSGRNLTGLVVARTETEVVLRDAQDREHRIPLKEVEQLVPQQQSLMPEQLLRDLTLEQAADLLEFLASLR